MNDARAPKGYYYVYFFGTENGSEVKIGVTKQSPFDRRRQHEHDAGRDTPMRTLAVVLGQRSDEQQLKAHFRPHKSRPRSREWFAAGEDMRGYLRWLRGQSFVARGEDELEELVPMPAQAWLPGNGHAKQPRQLALVQTEADTWADLEIDHVAEGDYYTHHAVTDAARIAMGSIDLDPASCRDANESVRALRFFGFRENGLLQEWSGNVWLNPPFGNWRDWVPKILEEWASGRVSQMCVLCESRVTTAKMFHPLVQEANAVLIMCGRYPFWGPNASTPDEGHAIFYFGDRLAELQEAYERIGTVFIR